MADNKSIEIWEQAWKPEVHTTDYALKRIKSAKSAKLTPVKIDATDYFGYFQGSHGRYETFLDHCPCGDFRRSKLPCKHIYRLAMELGLINGDFDSNQNAIVLPYAERVSLDDTIDMVEQLSEDAQLELLNIAGAVRTTTPDTMVFFNHITIELLNSGLIAESIPPKHQINFGKKSEIEKLLIDAYIPYNIKATKNVLVELCIKNIPERAEKTFGKYISVTIPNTFSPQSIHFYLHRKYDSDLLIDENMNITEVRLLDTVLPDDNITKQLISRGYYSWES